MHSTNKAFERYLRIEGDELRQVYADTAENSSGTKLAPKNKVVEISNHLKLK